MHTLKSMKSETCGRSLYQYGSIWTRPSGAAGASYVERTGQGTRGARIQDFHFTIEWRRAKVKRSPVGLWKYKLAPPAPPPQNPTLGGERRDAPMARHERARRLPRRGRSSFSLPHCAYLVLWKYCFPKKTLFFALVSDFLTRSTRHAPKEGSNLVQH
jgi:hypothetical protein